MQGNYHFSDEQKEYISKFIFSRQDDLMKKINIYHSSGKRKSLKRGAERAVKELALIHTILHEFYADEYNVSD